MVGASPNFSEVHLFRALFLFKEKGNAGRKRLVRLLGIGEGSVRTLLKKLKAKKLISSKKKGHHLTKKGLDTVENLLKKISKPKRIEMKNNSIIKGEKSIIIVHKFSDKIKKGIEERDIAIKEGANGAILLKFENNKLQFPFSLNKDEKVNPHDLFDEPIKNFNFKNKDLVIITFSDKYDKAENAALSIAMSLI